SVAPNQVVTKNYFANFDAFEFVFTTGGVALSQTEISVWGKNAAGQLVTAHRLVSSELLGAVSESVPLSINRIFVANFNSNDVSVIDGATNTVIATIPVGVNPAGVGVNPFTNRIYVGNLNSDDVSVIDGITDTVITTIPAGDGASSVGVNTATNAIYIANFNDSTVSVINGLTNTVIATIIPVGGLSLPTGIGVNS
ncbi:YncE family protein, partial [Paenibacillus sp. 28ISP30-2]|nr:YncE family protein [Paenibacillus sp. 28ISP30-2]